MPQPYQVWLRRAVYDYLESLELAERQRLLAWIEGLGQQPDRAEDFSQRETKGREMLGAIVAGHAVVWWVDSPVREVKVVAIRPAGT